MPYVGAGRGTGLPAANDMAQSLASSGSAAKMRILGLMPLAATLMPEICPQAACKTWPTEAPANAHHATTANGHDDGIQIWDLSDEDREGESKKKKNVSVPA